MKNILITASFLIAATITSCLFFLLTKNTTNTAIIYVMAIVLIARLTDGYVPGIIASFFGVICVNFVFTYPYLEFNFILEGYPVTFIGMTAISTLTSTSTSHLKKQARLISERDKMLLEAEKEKMRANLLRAVSHDLRTPLTSIIGTSCTYLESENFISSEERRNFVKNIYDDANWLLNMVENLLSITRINSDNTIINKCSEPLEEVVSEAVQRFHKRLPSLIVHISIPDEFIMIPMDATLIEQVIINLLENAYYHSESNAAVDFNVKIIDNYAEFKIIDYGIGIKKERLNNIFDGYTPSLNNSGDSKKGMGIGLSICKTIISAHGGEITAYNHDFGAVFAFTLPLGD